MRVSASNAVAPSFILSRFPPSPRLCAARRAVSSPQQQSCPLALIINNIIPLHLTTKLIIATLLCCQSFDAIFLITVSLPLPSSFCPLPITLSRIHSLIHSLAALIRLLTAPSQHVFKLQCAMHPVELQTVMKGCGLRRTGMAKKMTALQAQREKMNSPVQSILTHH